MGHLILGGTGTVGSGVVRELLARGEKMRVMTRSADKASALPAGVKGVIGDLQDPSTLKGAFEKGDRVFLLNGVTATELQEGLIALAEAKKAGAERIVYLSVHDVDKGPHLPHFASKIAIEHVIAVSGIPFTILRPNNFYQNDVWYRDVILQYGVYPQPLGSAGVSRVDTNDVARAAANALTKGGHEGKTYTLAGPEALTGEGTAAVYTSVTGREVRYGGDDLDAWAQQASQMLPAWMVYDFGLMYAMFQAEGLRASEAQLEETRAILGGPPKRFEDYARETVASWR
ncbi:MAG: SDR family oxidoreductase [Gemmatimonadaceae bacterium]